MLILTLKARRLIERAVNAYGNDHQREVWRAFGREHTDIRRGPADPYEDGGGAFPPAAAEVARSVLNQMFNAMQQRSQLTSLTEDEVADVSNMMAFIRSTMKTLNRYAARPAAINQASQLKRAANAKGGEGASVDGMAAFLRAKNLFPFISNDLISSTTPVEFIPQSNAHPEQTLHRQVATFLTWALPPDVPWTTIAHGGGGLQRGRILKALGMHAGWPDLHLIVRGRPVYVELKAASGTLSEAQGAVHSAITAAGGVVTTCRSVDEVQRFLEVMGVPLQSRLMPAECAVLTSRSARKSRSR